MGIFFTRINLEKIERNDDVTKGVFSIDIFERQNLFREFEFTIDGFDLTAKVIIYKKGEVFLEKPVGMMENQLHEYTLEQKLIWTALNIIFLAHHRKLNPRRFAVTKI